MMIRNVIFVGVGDGIGRRVSADLAARGCTVCGILLPEQAGQGIVLDPLSPDSIRSAAARTAERMPAPDMLVLNLDRSDHADHASILDQLDFEEMLRDYRYNAVGPAAVLYAFRPLLDRGDGKRVCVITTAEGSNNACRETGGFGRRMSRAALNMAMNLEFNGLRPLGYTMRMYCRDLQASGSEAGAFAAEYFLRNRSNEAESWKHSDENRLVLRDAYARELPW